MQGRENSGEARVYLEMLRSLYPGRCGYKSETGGIMENLRNSTNNEKVRNYHREFYRPDNFALIVTGQVEHSSLFEHLNSFDENVLEHISRDPLPQFVRPWTSAVPPLEKSVSREVLYGSDSEDNGIVKIAFRGPKASQLYEMSCLMLLCDYLTDTSVSPLSQAFVQCADPFCSKVSFGQIENTESVVYFRFMNVTISKLGQIREELFRVLSDIFNKGVDMDRMQSIIHRNLLETLNKLEDDPHQAVAFHAIGFFLFGENAEDLKERVNGMDLLRRAKKEQPSFWNSLFKTYLLDSNFVEIIGRPSIKLMEKLANDQRALVESRKKLLGEKGLAQKQEALDSAIDANDKEIPDDLLTIFNVPDAGKIRCHNVLTFNNFAPHLSDPSDIGDLSLVPFSFEFDDIVGTNFVNMSVLLDSTDISDEIRPFLTLWTESIFESSIVTADGVTMPYEDVVKALAKDTLDVSATIGLDGSTFSAVTFQQTICLNFKLEIEKYEKCINWLHSFLYNVVFTTERLKTMITKLLNSVSRYKRSGKAVATAARNDLLFARKANCFHTNFMRQENFLQKCLENLNDSERAKYVINSMQAVSQFLTNPSRMRLHVVSNSKKFPSHEDILSPIISSLLPQTLSGQQKFDVFIPTSGKILRDSNLSGSHTIIGIGSLESAYLLQSCNFEIGYEDPNLVPLLVLIEIIVAIEGPMWRLVRGMGLSYGYCITFNIESGYIDFSLIKSTNVVEAYLKSREIVMGFVNEEHEIDDISLEAAKSSIVFEIIEKEKTIGDIASECLLNNVRGLSKLRNQNLLKQIDAVTIDDVLRVCQLYLPPLFDPAFSVTAIVCHPTRVDDTISKFAKMQPSVNLKKHESLSDAFL